LIDLIANESLFKKLKLAGYKCKFINTFRPVFFTSPELFKNVRMSTTSEMNRTANFPFSTLNDIKNKKALYHDYTNIELISKGFNLPQYNAKTAADILIRLSDEYDFVLYEYFLTDSVGHSKDMNYAKSEIERIDSLIYGVVEKIKKSDKTVIVCSDHGNIEDIRTKSHTMNPAFFALWTTLQIKRISMLNEVRDFVLNLINK